MPTLPKFSDPLPETHSVILEGGGGGGGFRKLPFLSHLGKYLIKIGKISAKIHDIGKIKSILGLGMTPI